MKKIEFVFLAAMLFLVFGPAFGQTNSLFEKRGIMVNPIERSQIQSLVDAGTIDTEGYSELILNMAGMPSASVQNSGVVGAILIPDIPPFDEAFRKWGILPAVIELTADVKTGETNF